MELLRQMQNVTVEPHCFLLHSVPIFICTFSVIIIISEQGHRLSSCRLSSNFQSTEQTVSLTWMGVVGAQNLWKSSHLHTAGAMQIIISTNKTLKIEQTELSAIFFEKMFLSSKYQYSPANCSWNTVYPFVKTDS